MADRRVKIDKTQTGAFGAIVTGEVRPIVQLDAIYGLRTKTDTETFTASGGAATVEYTGTGNEYKCTTGTTVGGYGLIRSKRAASYRPGEGMVLRWTARFSTPAENGTQRAGGIASGVELSFGYIDTDFGILHRTGGALEIQTLTLTAGASGAETATITLAGTAYNVALTAGTAAFNAYEIASDSQFATGAGNAWIATQNGDTVEFLAQSVGDKTGTISYASTGTSAGSLTETAAGRAVTDVFYTQKEWNLDSLDGTGPSRMLLDPSKGNVYQVKYQYLGYGALTFAVENPQTGEFLPVHEIQYSNKNSSPSLSNPALKVGWFAASLGSTTDIATYGASAMAGITGTITPRRLPESHINAKAGIGTSYTNILSIRNRRSLAGEVNLSELIPERLSVAVEGTKPAQYTVMLNPVLGGTPNWSHHDEDNSPAEIDTSATTVTEGSNSIELLSGALGKSDGFGTSIRDLNTYLVPGDVLTIAVRATSGTTDTTVSLVWDNE